MRRIWARMTYANVAATAGRSSFANGAAARWRASHYLITSKKQISPKSRKRKLSGKQGGGRGPRARRGASGPQGAQGPQGTAWGETASTAKKGERGEKGRIRRALPGEKRRTGDRRQTGARRQNRPRKAKRGTRCLPATTLEQENRNPRGRGHRDPRPRSVLATVPLLHAPRLLLPDARTRGAEEDRSPRRTSKTSEEGSVLRPKRGGFERKQSKKAKRYLSVAVGGRKPATSRASEQTSRDRSEGPFLGAIEGRA